MAPNALRQLELEGLRTEIIRRITPVLQSSGVSEHEVSCSVHGDRADLDIAIRAPAEAAPVARFVRVRALDAIRAHGQTFGKVNVDVRAGGTVLDVDRVLVPIDGSALSRRAAGPAMTIARALSVPVQLVTVCSPGTSTLDDRVAMEALTDELCGETAPPLVLLSNDVGRALDDVLRMEPSMLCMATHGRSGLAGLVGGTNAKDVIQGATGPVVLVGPAVDDIVRFDAIGVLAADDGATRDVGAAIAAAAGAHLHVVPQREDADVAGAIIDRASDARLDLLVTGLRGRSLQHVVRRVRCPVLVIPPVHSRRADGRS